MIKFFRVISVLLLAFSVTASMAQSTATTSSPYSRYGLGNILQPGLPQNVAMGGISTALTRINGYNNINVVNPAANSYINLTTIDVAAYANMVTLSKTGSADQQNSNFRLSNIAFGIPVSKHSALSFGLMPYSELGYNYTQSRKGFGTSSAVDTNLVNNIYAGDGGLSKAYLGYGFKLVKGLSLGANVSYIFGNLKQTASTEYPQLYGVFNSRQEQSSSIGGINYDYGALYNVDISDEKRLTFGYSASASTKLNSQSTFVVSQYTKDFSTDDENNASDTVVNTKNPQAKIVLPRIQHFGVSYQQDRKFLVGVDYTMGQWSNLSINGVNQGLQNSSSLAFGGQINPNSNAIHSYLAVVDYRFGAHFDKTYLVVNNQTIKQFGVSAGVGLPLARNGSSFYKINISGEYGRRGTLSNSLVRENYFNIHIGFTLNDQWFIKYKYD
ncbi:hypothetical protein ABZR88_18405 [Mucilaginibacter yixingensis]|nr:hypothetical protein [Mucilaginibacter yixingensis]